MDQQTVQMMADNLRQQKFERSERRTLLRAVIKGLLEEDIAEVLNEELLTGEHEKLRRLLNT